MATGGAPASEIRVLFLFNVPLKVPADLDNAVGRLTALVLSHQYASDWRIARIYKGGKGVSVPLPSGFNLVVLVKVLDPMKLRAASEAIKDALSRNNPGGPVLDPGMILVGNILEANGP